MLWEEKIDASFMMRPVNEVVGGHEHQSPVVAPPIFFRALPLRVAQSPLATKHMKVGHSDVELSVGCTIDVRIADATLLSDAVACDDGLAVVYGRKSVAIVADGHEQRVGRIAEEGEEIGTHVLLCERLALPHVLSPLCRYLQRQDEHEECEAKSFHVV